MTRGWLYAGATLAVLSAALSHVFIRAPALDASGIYRELKPINHENCKSIPELKACEKIKILPSGVMYLACAGTIESRITWMPTLDALNVAALRSKSVHDYLATYNVHTGEIIKLDVRGLTDPRGLNLHGMDVVPDESDPSTLWIYLVNHRPHLDLSLDHMDAGANSVIEVLKSRVGANHVDWVQTVEDDKVMVTPNDIVGAANGQEFWFTNDNGAKTGIWRHMDVMFRRKSTFVGYCHVEHGCKAASVPLFASNGIVRASDGSILVGSYLTGQITVHKPRGDKTLEYVGKIDTDLPLDNLALSADGSVLAAAFPKLHLLGAVGKNSSLTAPSSVLRIYPATADMQQYKVEKIYEDEGQLGSFATTAAMYGDKLYLHGLMAHRMLACKIPLPR